MTTKNETLPGKPGPQKPKPETVKRTLPCALTDADRVRLGSELAEALGREAALESDLAAFKASHKAKVLPVQERIRQISSDLRDGHELRAVECRIVRDIKAGSVKFVRLDTEETVDERGMTDAERQLDLEDKLAPGQAPAAKAAPPSRPPAPAVPA